MGGDFGLALVWNPLVAVGVVCAGIFVIYAALVAGFRLRRVRVWGLSRGERRGMVGVVFLAAGLNWGYLIWRFWR